MWSNLDDYVLVDPPVDVELTWDNPWLCQLLEIDVFVHLRQAVASLLPGRRPTDLLMSEYAKTIRDVLKVGITPSDLQLRCQQAVALIDSFAEYGFVKGDEWLTPLPTGDWMVGHDTWYGPVVVGIGEHGALIHHDGAHRIVVSWLYGSPLPIRIVARHRAWDKIYKQRVEVGLYDYFPHPDLLSNATVRRDSCKRFSKVIS